MTANNIMILQK